MTSGGRKGITQNRKGLRKERTDFFALFSVLSVFA